MERKTFVLARYKSKQMISYIQKKYPDVSVLVELAPFGTGGAILQHWQVFCEYDPEVVIVLNGDHLVHLPMESLLQFYQKKCPVLLMIGVPSHEMSHDYINVNFDSERVLDKSSLRKSNIAYTGIPLFRFDVLRECMDQLPMGPCDVTKDIVEWIYKKYGGDYFVLKNEWDDLGTWNRYLSFLYRNFRKRVSSLILS